MANLMIERTNAPQFTTLLRSNWPALAWILTAIVVNGVSLRLAPEAYRQAVNMTDVPPGDQVGIRHALGTLHLTPVHLAWFQMFTAVMSSIVNLTIGWLLIRHAPQTRFTFYLAFVLLALSSPEYPPSIDDLLPGQPIAQLVIRLTTLLAIGGFFTLPFVFPDGRFVPRWTGVVCAYLVFSVFTFLFVPDLIPQGGIWTGIEAITTTILIASLAYSVVYRYRKVSSPEQRMQTRWVILGILIGIPGFFVADAMMRNISSSTFGIICLFGFLILIQIAFTAPVIAIGIAILHYRLFDIDVILSRTLVWLAMTLAVIGAYIGIVLGIGSLFDSERSLVLSLLATGLVAVAFQPLHARVQRAVNRFLFGERDDPYAVLARLGHHIEDSLSAADLLPQIVRTTAEALRLPYVALFLDQADGPTMVASSGVASASTLRLPLMYQGQSVGALEVATRAPGEVFSAADRRLLEDLARQVGVAARTVSLASDLQQSRERIVTSREEERRRLRRDLHDGLGAQLAALIMQAGSVRALIRSDPGEADQQLLDLRKELRSAVVDVRRLVLGLRPPALDELGLVGALRVRLDRLDWGGVDSDEPPLRVRFEAEEPLPSLSAAVEVAAFRIVEEAVTNVVRHSQASCVTVSLRHPANSLVIAIEDDGAGITAPVESSGMGMESMQERAMELGGTCVVTTRSDGTGTMVHVELPTIPAT